MVGMIPKLPFCRFTGQNSVFNILKISKTHLFAVSLNLRLLWDGISDVADDDFFDLDICKSGTTTSNRG